MTKTELTLVYEKADDANFHIISGNTECDGIAYWIEKKPVSLVGAVAFVRWQAMSLNGTWVSDMLQESMIYLQKKAILLSSLKPKNSL